MGKNSCAKVTNSLEAGSSPLATILALNTSIFCFAVEALSSRGCMEAARVSLHASINVASWTAEHFPYASLHLGKFRLTIGSLEAFGLVGTLLEASIFQEDDLNLGF